MPQETNWYGCAHAHAHVHAHAHTAQSQFTSTLIHRRCAHTATHTHMPPYLTTLCFSLLSLLFAKRKNNKLKTSWSWVYEVPLLMVYLGCAWYLVPHFAEIAYGNALKYAGVRVCVVGGARGAVSVFCIFQFLSAFACACFFCLLVLFAFPTSFVFFLSFLSLLVGSIFFLVV